MLKHCLRRVAVQKLAEEIKATVFASFCSHFDAGRVPCGRGSQATASAARRVAWSCGCQAGASRKRERVPVEMDCVACWNLSRGCTAGKAHALTCYPSKSARPHGRALGKLQAMLKADAEETETDGARGRSGRRNHVAAPL